MNKKGEKMIKRLSVVYFVVTLAMLFVFGNAFAQPSSKVSFKGTDLVAVPVSKAESTPDSYSSGWFNIWDEPIRVKTPSDKDLVMSFSAECGLLTDTTVMSRNLAKAISTAEAMIEVRVLVDGEPVAVGAPYTFTDPNQYSTSVMERDGKSVIYARRSQSLIAEFGGSFATCDQVEESGAYIITPECVDMETLQLVLSTMNANSFDFVAPDLDPIEHKIMVQAKLSWDTAIDLSDATLTDASGSAAATAFLGYSSFTMDTVRMVKGAEPVELQ